MKRVIKGRDKTCCAEFAKQSGLNALAGGGFMYPDEVQPSTQIEHDKTSGLWSVNGCCGGGCYVINDLEYCPWCSKQIATKPIKQNKVLL